MRWIDLLRMSSNSLKRRKLRTFLTVLGVVIGTASSHDLAGAWTSGIDVSGN